MPTRARRTPSAALNLAAAQVAIDSKGAVQVDERLRTSNPAVYAAGDCAELAGELFPYLTLAEALKLCAQSFTRDVSRLSCCAG